MHLFVYFATCVSTTAVTPGSELIGSKVSEVGVKDTAHLEDERSHVEVATFRQGGHQTGVLLQEFTEDYEDSFLFM